MTKQEYEDYKESVANFFEREGINCLSVDGESYFSWSSCDCCGSSLGGARYDATGYNSHSGAVEHYDVCTDCVYYAEYGQLDDETMLSMED